MLVAERQVKRRGSCSKHRRPASSGPREKTGLDVLAMRAAAIDLGRVRVGIAVSDELGVLAHPRPFLSGRSQSKLLDALETLAADESIEVFIVGLPLEMNGREGPAAKRARTFGAALQARLGARVVFVDERLSTVEAHGRLREAGGNARSARGKVDSAAAALLLQTWMDSPADSGA